MSTPVAVSVSIEPDPNGFIVHVQSRESAKDLWSKWYDPEHDAYVDANKPGFTITQQTLQGKMMLLRRVINDDVSVQNGP